MKQADSAANGQEEIGPGHGKLDVKGGVCSPWSSQEVGVGTGGASCRGLLRFGEEHHIIQR